MVIAFDQYTDGKNKLLHIQLVLDVVMLNI